MKGLYLFHVFSLVVFLFLGSYFMYELAGILEESKNGKLVDIWGMRYWFRAKFATRVMCIFSLFLFAFSVFVGLKTSVVFQKTRLMLILGGIGFFIWSIKMMTYPSENSIEDVFFAWLAYISVAIGLSIYWFWNYEKVSKLRIDYKDDILDDVMNE